MKLNLLHTSAPTPTSAFDFLTSGNTNQTFDPLTTAVQQTGSSFYKLLMAIAVVGLMGSLILTGVQLATNKNPQKKEENKSHLIWIFIGGIIVFGAMFILSLVQMFAAGL